MIRIVMFFINITFFLLIENGITHYLEETRFDSGCEICSSLSTRRGTFLGINV